MGMACIKREVRNLRDPAISTEEEKAAYSVVGQTTETEDG
jgi:hypothetical protein